jgi:hypothetical protein
MCNLITGVHTRIGPTGTHQVNRMIGHSGHRFGQLILDRSHTGFLKLPAVKLPAIVLKSQSYAAIANGFIRRQCLRFLKQWIS